MRMWSSAPLISTSPRVAQHVLAQLDGQQHTALVISLHAGIAEFGDMVQLLLYGGLAPVEGVKLIDHGFKRLVRVDGDGPVIETDGDGEALAQRFAVGVGDDDAALGVDGVVVATEKLEFPEAGALLGFRRVHAPFLVHAVTPLPVFLHLPPFLGL